MGGLKLGRCDRRNLASESSTVHWLVRVHSSRAPEANERSRAPVGLRRLAGGVDRVDAPGSRDYGVISLLTLLELSPVLRPLELDRLVICTDALRNESLLAVDACGAGE